METIHMDSGTPLPRYYPLPQFLLELKISSTAKILYALLLNRANLSQKNAWEDEQGRVYFVYTIEELAADMKKGQTAIKNGLNELSKLGLLERMRLKKRFYKNPEQDAAFGRCIDVMTRLIQKYGPGILAEVRKTDERFGLPHHKRPRNMKYLQSYLEYICRHKKNDAA